MEPRVDSGKGQCLRKPKLNRTFEIREIDNGFIVQGWHQGNFFEVYREDLQTVEYFIINKLNENA